MEGNGELKKERERLQEGHCVSSVDQSSFWHRESLQQPCEKLVTEMGRRKADSETKKNL